MKKMLSLLMVLSMVCSFVFVSASVEAADAIRFNFADGEMSHSNEVVNDGIYVYMQTDASGGDKTENAEITGSVTLTKSGYYDLTYLIGYKTGGAASASAVTLTVGEYEFINDDSYTEDVEGYKVTDLYPMKKYEKKLYWFDAGTVDIKFSAAPTSAARWRFQAAYVDFVPVKIDSLRFNFADYAPTTNSIWTNDTNGQLYIYQETSSASTPTEGITVTGTIKLPKGYYDVTYLMGYKSSEKNASKVDLTIGEYEYDNTETPNVNTALEGYCSTTYFPMSEYNKNMLWFDGGDVTITLHVNPTTATNARCRYQAANVEFKPVNTIHLDFADGQMSHQYEIVNNGSYVYMQTDASGGDKTENAEITMSVNIAEAGYYDLTYLIGYKTGGAASASAVTLTVGEYEFTNDDSYTEDAQGYRETDLYPMKKYEKKLYWFDAGTVDIKFSAAPTSAARWRFQAAYIEFSIGDEEQSNENSLTEENGTVTATVYYDSAVSGTPILALYNGNELIDVNIGDTITDATDCVTIHVVTSKVYDKAKVFVWDDLNTMQTDIGEVVLTK